jgi:hypothetical protein
MDSLLESDGFLIVFDRLSKKSWSKKITWKTEHISGKTIHIVGF